MKTIDLGNGAEYEISANGTERWFLNGKLHRTDGHAITYADGEKRWYINGKIHRTDGPAVECSNGDKRWYINGKEYSEKDFDQVRQVLWAI